LFSRPPVRRDSSALKFERHLGLRPPLSPRPDQHLPQAIEGQPGTARVEEEEQRNPGGRRDDLVQMIVDFAVQRVYVEARGAILADDLGKAGE